MTQEPNEFHNAEPLGYKFDKKGQKLWIAKCKRDMNVVCTGFLRIKSYPKDCSETTNVIL
tara:strand:- start:454 stop:633 length:180 start_codon:yes stop_codon:yes gene_type:complete